VNTSPIGAGDQPGQCRQPQPIGRLVAGPPEVDLAKKNRAKLEKALAPFVKAGRKVSAHHDAELARDALAVHPSIVPL
jgi:hypothetical protein